MVYTLSVFETLKVWLCGLSLTGTRINAQTLLHNHSMDFLQIIFNV